MHARGARGRPTPASTPRFFPAPRAPRSRRTPRENSPTHLPTRGAPARTHPPGAPAQSGASQRICLYILYCSHSLCAARVCYSPRPGDAVAHAPPSAGCTSRPAVLPPSLHLRANGTQPIPALHLQCAPPSGNSPHPSHRIEIMAIPPRSWHLSRSRMRAALARSPIHTRARRMSSLRSPRSTPPLAFPSGIFFRAYLPVRGRRNAALGLG